MPSDVDYHEHLARESARFAEAVRRASPGAPVPPCPGWNADDLLWHLGEVQFFWSTVVREKLSGEEAEKLTPERPAGRADLLAFYARASRGLGEILDATSPDAPAWTWSDDRTVRFILRRQAHEALIHRVDAELTAGDRTPIDARLAADGVDEVLRVMYGGCPDWGTFRPAPARTVRIRATDTGHSWLVTLGRFTGTDPASGTSYDDADIHAAQTDTGARAAAGISGAAADLDCWLWHRPATGPVERSGDPGVLGDFDAYIKPGIN
jgi:uncharacterized protein (TIGR03083 family)